jgi:hypothetical protein
MKQMSDIGEKHIQIKLLIKLRINKKYKKKNKKPKFPKLE